MLPVGKKMVGVERFELPTSCSQSRRATRLRYTPTLSKLNFLSNHTDALPLTFTTSLSSWAACSLQRITTRRISTCWQSGGA